MHAKVTIIDDILVRIGSANMNNRSLGFDTECDLSLEAAGRARKASRAAISSLRNDLLAHWLGCVAGRARRGHRQRTAASARPWNRFAKSGFRRLRPIEPRRLHPPARVDRRWHIGDPMSPADSFARGNAAERSSASA